MEETTEKTVINVRRPSKKHHMTIHWLDYVDDKTIKAKDASLRERTMLV